MLLSPCRCIEKIARHAQEHLPNCWPLEKEKGPFCHLLFPRCLQSDTNFRYIFSPNDCEKQIAPNLTLTVPSYHDARNQIDNIPTPMDYYLNSVQLSSKVLDAAPKYKIGYSKSRFRSKGKPANSIALHCTGKQKSRREGSSTHTPKSKIVASTPPSRNRPFVGLLARDQDHVYFNPENQNHPYL